MLEAEFPLRGFRVYDAQDVFSRLDRPRAGVDQVTVLTAPILERRGFGNRQLADVVFHPRLHRLAIDMVVTPLADENRLDGFREHTFRLPVVVELRAVMRFLHRFRDRARIAGTGVRARHEEERPDNHHQDGDGDHSPHSFLFLIHGQFHLPFFLIVVGVMRLGQTLFLDCATEEDSSDTGKYPDGYLIASVLLLCTKNSEG